MSKKPKQTVTLPVLRKSLNECHLTSGDKKLRFLLDVKDPSYYLHRIMECVAKCEVGEEVAENSKLAIQLFNLYRVVQCGPIQPATNQESRAGGDNPNGDRQ